MNYPTIISIIVLLLLVLYGGLYFFFRKVVQREEVAIVRLFLLKTSKIPALIEVMRPHVMDASAFDSITRLHSEAMVHRYDALYDLLEHNSRIEHEFSFLMKLSMQIPLIQKDKYFLYIRDFVMQYERDMKGNFASVNQAIARWNQFIMIKNLTGIGLILPGSKKETIR